MIVWIYTLSAVLIVSLISLVGIFTLAIKLDVLKKFLLVMVSFSAGALLGGAFFHLLPEAASHGFTVNIAFYVLCGIISFFVLESLIHWRHCHIPTSDDHPHPFVFMNLIGDGLHNFIDGMIIAGSFIVSVPLGISTTLAVIFHEIPQEIGEYGVLVHGGFSRGKALFYNFMSALAAIVGALLVLSLNMKAADISTFLVPFTAGGFIYIATSDLFPEMQKEPCAKNISFRLLALLLGLGVMLAFVLAE